jgi:galactose mutarotase-like enzyme
VHGLRREADPEVPVLERVTLVSPGGLEAAFVPGAGMVGTSLRRSGRELLARRHGLTGYLDRASTYGIPLLAPWANRLAAVDQSWDGVGWQVRPGDPGVHLDEFGQAIHGLLAGAPGWRESAAGADADHAWLHASYDLDAGSPVAGSFPFPHRIDVEIDLAADVLRITTAVTSTGDRRVPLAVGWHPWFAFPDVARAQWRLRGPLRSRAVLDERRIPTGEVRMDPLPEGPLGERFLDDVFLDVEPGTEVAVGAGDLEVVVRYCEGYDVAVVFAPLDLDVVCIEPMTAPTDPFAGRWPVRAVEPGETATLVFEVEVVDRACGPGDPGH